MAIGYKELLEKEAKVKQEKINNSVNKAITDIDKSLDTNYTDERIDHNNFHKKSKREMLFSWTISKVEDENFNEIFNQLLEIYSKKWDSEVNFDSFSNEKACGLKFFWPKKQRNSIS